MEPIGSETEKGILQHLRIGQQQRALAKIVQEQSRERDREPCESDWHAPEMPHIRIHGFTAGDGQECRAEHRKGDQGWRMHQKCEGGNRTYRCQDLRRQYDAAHAKGSDHDEPREHDRAEDAADEAGSSALNEEKSDQNGDG